MDLRQLRYFVKVVDEGNISRAAKLLYVAQPSLGVHITHLEDELGVRLLTRHSRGVTPTAAGKLLYERASDVLQRVDAIKREIRAEDHRDGTPLVVGFPPSTMNLLGADLMAVADKSRQPGRSRAGPAGPGLRALRSRAVRPRTRARSPG